MKQNFLVFLPAAALSAQTSPNAQPAFDLVVYGGTACELIPFPNGGPRGAAVNGSE